MPTKRPEILIAGDLELRNASVQVALQTLQAPPRNLRLIICSEGGDVSVGRLLVCRLLAARTVATRAEGECSSAAIPVLAAGRPGHRTVSPYIVGILHGIQQDVKARSGPDQLQRLARNLRREQLAWARMLADLVGRPNWAWRFADMLRGERFLTARDFLELGLVDRIE